MEVTPDPPVAKAAAPRGSGLGEAPLVAVVLPPGEGFGPGRAGAVALIVRRLVGVLPALVIGGPQYGPVFDDAPFRAARPVRWWPGGVNARYAVAVSRLLRPLRPALIEVHNRIEVARMLARRFPATPVSLFLHNDPQGMRRARSARERAALLASLARVVTVSEFLRARLTQGVPAGRWPMPEVLPNAIDLAALPPFRAERDQLILFAGRVVADKGADSFAAACARALPALPGWRAEMIGADRSRPDSPDTPFVRDVRRGAEAAGVRMLGYRDHPGVLDAMSRAAMVVVPSRWQEPFGLTALEAMACGAALIAAPRGGLPEVAGDAALYADPDDPAALGDAIVRVARDAALRANFAEAGRARARRFGLEQAAARLAALRSELVEGYIGTRGPE
ncbi:MAG: glycosyltransferase family 4 protein [Acetobacteraceae bacterium]